MSDSMSTQARALSLLAEAEQRGGLDGPGAAALRSALLEAGPARAAIDQALAALWRSADPGLRNAGLRDALEELVLGSALVAALLRTIDGGGVDGSGSGDGQRAGHSGRRAAEAAANAALWVLRNAADDPLEPAGWRRVCAVARRQRHHAVPDVEAAVLIAERGPERCFATVALTAFRDGPEDADDRLAALRGLGRFRDPRVAGWLDGVVRGGGAMMDAVQALSHVAAQAQVAGDEAALEQVFAALLAAVPIDETAPRSDGWVRWMALDLLSRLVGEAAVPMLQAAFAAGGHVDVPWFLPQVAARVESLGSVCPAPPGAALPVVPAFADLAAEVASRSPRIARRAAVLAAQRLESGDDADLRTALRGRAAIERALVARGQLVGSFLDPAGLPAVALPDSFRPWSEVLPDADRAALVVLEDAWLG